MHRLEGMLDRHDTPIPRIALSATLGDMDGVMQALRPNKSVECTLIHGEGTGSPLKFQLRGYVNRPPVEEPSEDEYFNAELPADQQVAQDLFETLRGDSHLVFANSRQRCEHFAVMLSDLGKKNHLSENEFFPHHGSLSKELRSDLESRLQKERLPTSAICTMTLELGIDIGKVKSVCQVTAPHSVSSLRQRLGRSGRRGDPAILRMYITENELSHDSNVIDMLRVELLQTVAMTHLLLGEKWFEPADRTLPHFSTLIHQILAVVAQWGGVRADQLWQLLCVTGPFGLVDIDNYKAFLKHMGESRLISQLSSGEIVLGLEGEKLVSHYSFYAVFKTPEEYRVVVGSKTIGTLPVDSALLVGQSIVFGGRRWKVEEIDAERKSIHVVSARGGRPPKFGGGGIGVHDRVRQEMFKIYAAGDHRISLADSRIEFMDSDAKRLFSEGLHVFRDLDLASTSIFKHSKYVYVIPWMGDKIVNTLTIYLNYRGFKASSYAGAIEVDDADIVGVKNCLSDAVSLGMPSNTELAAQISNKDVDKYDYLLTESFLNQGYGARYFDSKGALEWLISADLQGRMK
jgi:ATP-dependent Lhr-like helicase